ncbi:MAG: hypothetical protein EPO09_00130 [Aquabacterium sp.]|uniref:hypothetical protein n=1 Tax=Aquabacterium sp. TaxID=1872578 RepID=UPI0011F70541|nr:hypothetical protein [Aquabacterium sp.]TAL00119.1 MAG: hypothetical protein EPO09_00130 [Aquabacterium sp.]
MSTTLIDKSSSRRWLWLPVVALAAAGAYVLWQRSAASSESSPRPQALAPAPGGGWPIAGSVGNSDGPSLIPRGPVSDTKPADITQEAWDALSKALENDPNKAQERQRLVSYLRFQRAVTQWSEMKDGPNVAGRQALARELVDQLPLHAGNGEVNSGEASLLLRALAGDLEPDPTRQQAWIDTQLKRLQGTQSEAQAKALAEEKRKNDEFAALQADLVAKWQNTPTANRDPATLEAQLQALREKVYGASGR